jgi:hypothetical protein
MLAPQVREEERVHRRALFVLVVAPLVLGDLRGEGLGDEVEARVQRHLLDRPADRHERHPRRGRRRPVALDAIAKDDAVAVREEADVLAHRHGIGPLGPGGRER